MRLAPTLLGMTSAPAPQELAHKAVRGVAVTTLAQVLRLLIQIASVVILARLLTPRDYGLVAMVLAIVGVAELLRDMGLSPAAIRAPTLSRQERDNLFWLNTAAGAGLTVVVVVVAPLIAKVYDRPELTAIAWALAPTYFLSGLATQYRVDLTRRLRFGVLAAIDVACALIPLAIGIVAAVLGAQYWALVAQQLSSGVLACALLLAGCRWLPRAYRRDTPVGHFVRLGMSFVFGGLMSYLTRNADNVLVGHQFGAASLGAYTRSVQLVRTPLAQLQAPFGTVALPVLAGAGDDDERMMSGARRAQVALVYPILAGVTVLVVTAPAFVEIALGDSWAAAAPIMAWVAVSGGLACLTMPVLWVFAAKGLGRAITSYNAIATVIALCAMFLGLQWGAPGVAAGVAVAQLVALPLALWILRAEGRLAVGPLAFSASRVLALSLAAGALAAAVLRLADGVTSPVAQVLLAGAIVSAAFAAAAGVGAYRRDYKDIWVMVRLLRRRAEPSSDAEHADRRGPVL